VRPPFSRPAHRHTSRRTEAAVDTPPFLGESYPVNTLVRYPVLLALLSAGLFGAATPLSKVLLLGLSPRQSAGLFYLGAACSLAPGLLVTGRLRPTGRAKKFAYLAVQGSGPLIVQNIPSSTGRQGTVIGTG
jgi:hypothetical protein